MADFEYNDSNLQKLFDELSPRRRAQALNGGFRREANRLKKASAANLRQSLKSNRDLERGIRTIVFKKIAGFRVTVGTKKNKGQNGTGGLYANAYQQKKSKPRRVPVLLWAEDGTVPRHTRLGIFKKRRYTGQVKPKLFLEKAKRQLSSSITDHLRTEIVNSIVRTSKKYGCS